MVSRLDIGMIRGERDNDMIKIDKMMSYVDLKLIKLCYMDKMIKICHTVKMLKFMLFDIVI